jgi:hypothetical protein
VEYDDIVGCNDIQQYTMLYDGIQWDFGTFPLGRPPDKDFRHITEFCSLKINEWMDKPHGEVYPLEIDPRVGHHQNMNIEEDTYRVALKRYLESLVIPLGWTDALDTF